MGHNVAVHPAEGRRAAPLPRIGCNGLLGDVPRDASDTALPAASLGAYPKAGMSSGR